MKTINNLLNLSTALIGVCLIITGITGLTMPQKKNAQTIAKVVKCVVPIPLKVDSIKIVHDSVFVITRKIKKVIILQDKLIDSELVFNAYYQSFMLKRKPIISARKGLKKDSLNYR